MSALAASLVVVGVLAAPAFAASASAPSASTPHTAFLPGAERTASPTPDPNDQSGLTPSPPPTGASPVAPTIDDPGDVTSATARFRGTGTPGDGVRVGDPAVPSASVCTSTVGADGSWSCLAAVRSGPGQVFTVFDTTNGSLVPADSPAVDVIVPPTIAASGPTTGSVSGTGTAGATVTVAPSVGSVARTTTVGPDGRWVLSFGSGEGALATGTWTMSATQTVGTALGYRSDLRSTASVPRTITIDRTAPAAPVITAPAPGARVRTQPITVVGTGEDGAVATVYIDAEPVCQATVSAGSWRCTTAGESIPDGTRSLVAGQRDAAGNFSPVTAPISLAVSGAPVDGAPSAAPSSPTRSSGAPAPGTSPSPGAPSAPGSGAGGSGSGSTGPGGPGGSGGDPGRAPGNDTPTGWAVATAYDGGVPTIQGSISVRTLLLVLVGIASFLVLVAVPIKLVARSVRGRIAWRAARFTGRNRSVAEQAAGDDDGMPTWATVALAVGIASVLMLLGTGIEPQARYARLSIAVVLGTSALATGVVLATRWAVGSARTELHHRISPVLLAAAVVAAVVTRSADLSPALLLGVLVVPSVRRRPADPTRLDATLRSRSATGRTVVLLALAAIGWGLHSALSIETGAHGFWGELTSEFAITLCVGGLGSVVTTMLPIARTDGAALWSTSRTRYAALASVAVALAVAVYSGTAGTHLSALSVAVAVVGCAVVGVMTWTWVRVVEPVLGD
ncbi:hypothetical protein [Curtobacterium sp. RRHDQ10]|uniref:hypothetical protein n=1 Tax=Curtobacterium phyllosphaerae TaxID=3413379 RepID=UPI003BF29F1F